MRGKGESAFLAFALTPGETSESAVETLKRAHARPVCNMSFSPLDEYSEVMKSQGFEDVKITAEQFMSSGIKDFLRDSGVRHLWVEYHPAASSIVPDDFTQRLLEISEGCDCIPVSSDLGLLTRFMQHGKPPEAVALKGSEASGLVSTETTGIMFSTLKGLRDKNSDTPSLIIWGGIFTPEASAAYLCSGLTGIVFESIHWLTDMVLMDNVLRKRLAGLRPEHTALSGPGLGISIRVFDKGNSKAAKELKHRAHIMNGHTDKDRARAWADYFCAHTIPPLESGLKNSELIPLGPEAAFAESFAERFGQSAERAVPAFSREIWRICGEAEKTMKAFSDSKLAERLGIHYPLIQGAMSWISDRPEFCLAVAGAGALPTFALGLKEAGQAEQELNEMEKIMGGLPYAVNIITLSENPFRKEQLELIERIRPPFVVIAAGEPSHAVQFLEKGMEVLYVAPDQGLLKMALEAGVKYIILEGNEAGGHVGEFSSLTLWQTAYEMRRKNPSLFHDRFLVYAGGIFDSETAFRAAMLGADGIQMGTPYLATKEIVSTGALSPLYQRMILESGPGMTLVSGQSIGLRVRSLRTSKTEAISQLENDFVAGREDEVAFRKKLEGMSAGSLFIAARGRDLDRGFELDDETCVREGQFMSGASAGILETTITLDELHRSVSEGPFVPMIPSMETDPKSGTRWRPLSHQKQERIAITGSAIVNSLGNSTAEIWDAVLGLKSGITEVPASRVDLGPYYDPNPMARGKTYCKIGAFQNVAISRKELGISPHDFRTMAQSTRLTLWLAKQAIEESRIVDADIPRDRIGVLVSQNSGEVASTISDLSIQANIHDILRSIKDIISITPEVESEIKRKVSSENIQVDDTTLLGRLNCAAGGFICNKYGFMGPSYSVSAACATSLVALYSAVQMIRNNIIDAAIVGGGEELLRPAHFLEFSALGALAGLSGVDKAPSEYSRPFDLDRDGMVLGEGGGIIVIERESVAKKRGARIHAYITGVGASNNNQGMVESLARSQEIAIRQSFMDASHGPEEVDLVECHATSTKQGDVEEIKALKTFFPEGRTTALSSFKSQIGHTLGASGINSLIRGMLAAQYGVVPPTINYRTPDPECDLEGWGFHVHTQPAEWKQPQDSPRRFMVNAFGFGGANYVIQLEESLNGKDTVFASKDIIEPASADKPSGPGDENIMKGVSFLTTRISGQPHRLGVVARDDAEAMDKVAGHESLTKPGPLSAKESRTLARQGIFIAPSDMAPRPLAFVFAGQGTHYPGMGKELYDTFPEIRRWMDEIAGVADFDILDLLFYSKEEDLQKTRWQQPAMFTMEYAMVRVLMSLGVTPSAMAGHSLGELVALCVAGVFPHEDGFRIVNKRAECMDKAAGLNVDPGIMFATDAPFVVLDKKLEDRDNIYFTNFNAPSQTVLGGNTQDALAFMEELKDEGYRTTQLRVSMAFHSPIMKVIHDELEDYIAHIQFHPPRIPVISNTTMKAFPQDPDAIKKIVMAHLESPVHWMQNVETMSKDFGINLFVEIGPRDTLCGLVSEILEKPECIGTCLPDEEASIYRAAAAKLFSLGHMETEGRPVHVDSPGTSSRRAVRTSPVLGNGDSILSVVQREINSFVLESFGKYLIPQIVEAVRREADPSFSEEKLKGLLGTGDAGVPSPWPAARKTGHPSVNGRKPGSSPAGKTQASPAPVGDILEEVIRIIMDATGYERDEIEPDMDIRQDLAIRSSRLPVIMDAAEQGFGIKINIEDFIGVRTVREMADRIESLKGDNFVFDPPPSSAAPKPLAPALGQSPSTASDDDKNKARPEPLKRFVFREAPLEEFRLDPIRLQQDERVAILTPGSDSTLTRDLVSYIEKDLGGTPLVINYLKGNPDTEAFDVREPEGREKCAERLAESGSMAGLVILFDAEAAPVAGEMGRIPSLLTGFFQALQGLLRSSSKKFCLAIGKGPASDGFTEVAFEGTLGMLLSAALEYGSVLFRGVQLDGDTDLKTAIDSSLSTDTGVSQIIFRGQDPFTLEAREYPAPIGEKPDLALGVDDVVILSGGGKGITSHLARALGPFKPHMILLGRSDSDPLIAHNLHDISDLGIDVEYVQCDVTDAQSVGRVVGEVAKRFGKIDGIIHGAGILKDSFAELMSPADFEQVMNVKVLGAWNLYRSAKTHGLRFLVPLSSITAFQGNVGQANYCAANRALSSLINVIGREADPLLTKVFFLPPIEGAGMADDPEMKELLRLRGMESAYVHVNELGHFFCRELFMGPRQDCWVMPARALPDTKTARIRREDPEDEGAFFLSGFAFPKDRLPMIQEIESLDFSTCKLVASRTFSLSHDQWIEDHKPFQSMKYPLVSGIMAIEAFLEATALLYPHLNIMGVRKVAYRDIIECPPGIDRKTKIVCFKTDDIQLKSMCQASISSQDISPTGRPLDSWSSNYEGQVLFGGQDAVSFSSTNLNILPTHLDTPPMNRSDIERWYERRTALRGRYRVLENINGSGPHVITGSTLYKQGEDFAGLAGPRYIYSPYLLEALMHLVSLYIVIRDKEETRTAIPAGIGEMRFTRNCLPGEKLHLEARMRQEDSEGHHWDARALDRDRAVIMAVKGLSMKWLPD